MWNYEKRLQYPVKITRPNAEIAKVVTSQFGGPNGEVGAAMRYLSQRKRRGWRCNALPFAALFQYKP